MEQGTASCQSVWFPHKTSTQTFGRRRYVACPCSREHDRCNVPAQPSADRRHDVHQFLQKPVVLSGQHIVIPDTRTDKHLFDTGNLTDLPQHVQILRMVDLQRRTGGRCKAFFAALAKTCRQLFFTGRMAKISGWAADIMIYPLNPGSVVSSLASLSTDSTLRTAIRLP